MASLISSSPALGDHVEHDLRPRSTPEAREIERGDDGDSGVRSLHELRGACREPFVA
jgi:hypothetical protein